MFGLGLGLRPENAGLGLETSGLGLEASGLGLGLVPPGLVNITAHLDCLLGLYWTGLTLLNGFSFLFYFIFFILDRVVD